MPSVVNCWSLGVETVTVAVPRQPGAPALTETRKVHSQPSRQLPHCNFPATISAALSNVMFAPLDAAY